MKRLPDNILYSSASLQRGHAAVRRLSVLGIMIILLLIAFDVHASSHEMTIRVIEDDDFRSVTELSLPPPISHTDRRRNDERSSGNKASEQQRDNATFQHAAEDSVDEKYEHEDNAEPEHGEDINEVEQESEQIEAPEEPEAIEDIESPEPIEPAEPHEPEPIEPQ